MSYKEGEIPGIREGQKEMQRQLQKSGVPQKQAERISRDAMTRADRNIRAGKQPKPTIRGPLDHSLVKKRE